MKIVLRRRAPWLGLLALCVALNGHARPEPARELLAAVRQGDLARTQALLASGVDVNARVPGEPPALLLAVREGRTELATLLLHAGAAPDTGSASGASVLVESVAARRHDLARELVVAGADVDQRHRAYGTALDVAERDGDLAFAAYLRAHGAEGSGKSIGDLVCVKLWAGEGYCARVEARQGLQFELQVLRVEGCSQGCAAHPSCSAGHVVGGSQAGALGLGQHLVVPGSCLTQTGLGPAR